MCGMCNGSVIWGFACAPGTRGSWAPPNHVVIVVLRLLLCRPCLFTGLKSMGGGMTCAFTLTRRFAPFACTSFMLGIALSIILRTVPRLAWPICFRAGRLSRGKLRTAWMMRRERVRGATGRLGGVEPRPLPRIVALLARCCPWCSVTVRKPLAGTLWGAVAAGAFDSVLV